MPRADLSVFEWVGNGCPPHSRLALLKAFVAKAVWDFATTRGLIDAVRHRPALRRLCGWETLGDVPSESTFSRAFDAFAGSELPRRILAAVAGEHFEGRLVGHISQAAIPLAQMSAGRVASLYDLADAAYDAKEIRGMAERLGHVAIIDHNPRKGEKTPFDPAEAERYKQRSSVERVNSHLHEQHGGRHVMVRGAIKVAAHLGFGLIVIAAEQMFRMMS